jgi:flagellar biosynthesis regulator FlaF
MSSDRVLAKETLGAVVRWQFPDLGEAQVDELMADASPDVDETVRAAGDGLRQQFSLLRDLIGALSQPDHGLDDETVNGIMTLAVDVTRQLRRRERHGSEPLLDAMQTILGGLPVGRCQ